MQTHFTDGGHAKAYSEYEEGPVQESTCYCSLTILSQMPMVILAMTILLLLPSRGTCGPGGRVFTPEALQAAQLRVDQAGARLGLAYQPVINAQLAAGAPDQLSHNHGRTRFEPANGRITVEINPEIAFDPVMLELTLIHENVHVGQYQSIQRMERFTEWPGFEVDAYRAELDAAQARGVDPDYQNRRYVRYLQELQERLGYFEGYADLVTDMRAGGASDAQIAQELERRGLRRRFPGILDESGFAEELQKKSSTEPPKKPTEIRKLETTNKLLKELVSEHTPPELKPIGNASEYLVLFDLHEQVLKGKVNEKYKPENLKRSYPEIPEARQREVLEKLMRDRMYELQKARGEALWAEQNGSTPAEQGAVIKTRAFLKTWKDILIKRPDVGLLESLKAMSAGEAGFLFGPILVDGAVAWYDHGWQAGVTTMGQQGAMAVGVMVAAHYSPLVATTLQYAMPILMPVIAWHAVNGTVYVAGNLFKDYLIRDDMIRLLYLERGATVSGLGFPAGTKLLNFFDSAEGRGLDRQNLHTKYRTLDELANAISRYKALLDQEPEGVTGPIWDTLRDEKVWQRITDRAQADWFESVSKELETSFKGAERDSKAALAVIEGQAEALRSLAQKDYEGAQGFILDVRYAPEKPKLNDKVTVEVMYAVASVAGQRVTVDLPLEISGPSGSKREKLLDQKEFSFDEDHPLIIGRQQTTLEVSEEGNYELIAILLPDQGKPDRHRVVFSPQRCLGDKLETLRGLQGQLESQLERAKKASSRLADTREKGADVEKRATDITKELNGLTQRDPMFEQDAAQAPRTAEEIKRAWGEIDEAGKSVALLRETTKNLAGVTCDLAEKAKQADDPSKASKLAYNASQFAKQTGKQAEDVQKVAGDAKSRYDAAVRAFEAIEQLHKRAEGLRLGFAALSERRQELQKSLAAVAAEAAQGHHAIAEVNAAVAEAARLIGAIVQLLQPCNAIASTKSSIQNIIQSAESRRRAVNDARAAATTENTELHAIIRRGTAQAASADTLATTVQQSLASIAQLKGSTHPTADAKATIDTIDMFAQLAQDSAKAAEDCAVNGLVNVVVVPDLAVFNHVSEIKAALQHVGLVMVLVAAKEKPPSKDKEFKVASQSPGAGAKVKRGSTVTVALYQRFVDEVVTVPDLSAFNSVSEMKAALAQVGLTGSFVVAKMKPPTREKAFKHQSQTPVPGELVPRTEPVIVYIYPKFEGKDVMVPNLATYSDTDSMKATLKGLGLNWAFTAAKPPTKDKAFKFAGQTPEAGTMVPEGETVTISMYQKFGTDEKDKVPNVIDDSLERAVATLEAAGLRVGSIDSGAKPPNPAKALRIYQQSPAAGEALPADKVVSLKQYGSAAVVGLVRLAGSWTGIFKRHDTGGTGPVQTVFTEHNGQVGGWHFQESWVMENVTVSGNTVTFSHVYGKDCRAQHTFTILKYETLQAQSEYTVTCPRSGGHTGTITYKK